MSITYHLAEWGGNYGNLEMSGRCYNFRAPRLVELILRQFLKCFFITTKSGCYVFHNEQTRKLVIKFK